MSTRKLLGGSAAREGAQRRRRAVNEMRRLARMYQLGTPAHSRVENLVSVLEETRTNPKLTDAEKDVSFRRLLNRKR